MSSEQEILRTKVIEKAWADPVFKQQLLADPKAALKAEFGISIPESIVVNVVEEKSNNLYLVLPPNPAELLDAKSQTMDTW